jgi:hypothetical protein
MQDVRQKELPRTAFRDTVAADSYAFTASNTVTAGPAGEAESSAVTGYTSSNTAWTIDPSNQTEINQVTFDLNPVTSSTQVYAGDDNGTTITWSSLCSQGAITAQSALETCTFSGTEPTVADTDKLAISAVN